MPRVKYDEEYTLQRGKARCAAGNNPGVYDLSHLMQHGDRVGRFPDCSAVPAVKRTRSLKFSRYVQHSSAYTLPGGHGGMSPDILPERPRHEVS